MQTAMEIGLVHKIVDHPRDFQAAVREVATKIQLLAPGAVGATKQVLLDCLNQPISNSLIEARLLNTLFFLCRPRVEVGS